MRSKPETSTNGWGTVGHRFEGPPNVSHACIFGIRVEENETCTEVGVKRSV